MRVHTLLLSLFLFVLFLSSDLSAQVRHVSAPKAPAAVLADSAHGRVHVLTAGVDRDFDGILDPEDIAPAWFAIDAVSEAIVDSLTFDGFFNSFPIRIGADFGRSRFYMAQKGRVRAYNSQTLELAEDTVVLGAYTGVSIEPLSGALVLHGRPNFTDPGHVFGVHPTTGDTLVMAKVGINPQMSVLPHDDRLGVPVVYTLNEGSGGNNATLSYIGSNPNIYDTFNSGKLGGGGSQIMTLGTTAYVVLGGTHQIRMIDTRTHTDRSGSPISTRTGGFDSPRALAFQGDSVLVLGTYAGDLRRFRIATGELIDSIEMPGKVESVAIRDSLAFAAIKYTGATYDLDSQVVVVGLMSGTALDTIAVGLDPVYLFIDRRGDLNVLGYGGSDSTRWWMVFDGVTRAKKGERRFAGRLGFPLRVAYDGIGDSLYIVLSDSLWAYSVASFTAPRTLVAANIARFGDLTGVSLGGDYLLVNELPKNFGTDPGYVHVIDRASRERVAMFMAGSFLTMTTPIRSAFDEAASFYVLSEGTFGSPSSTLGVFEYQPNILGSDTLGRTANHVFVHGEALGVTMSGSHEFVVVDLEEWEVTKRYSTGTSGNNGPREAVLLDGDDLGLVTTYAGDVRTLNQNGVVKITQTGGKAEGVAMLADKAFVANTFTADYSADSTVAIIGRVTLSIERDAEIATATTLEQNFPNPATTTTRIRFSVPSHQFVQLELYSMRGERVATLVEKEMEPGTYTITVATDGLASGDYIYTLQSGAIRLSNTMKVVR